MTAPSVLTVISCGKQKSLDPDSEETVPARELYSSGTHTCKERFAEASDGYYIASAKHGLLDPDEEIGYYDLGIDELSESELRRWASDVAGDLQDLLTDGDYDGLVVLARADYVAALEPHFSALPVAVLTPFQTCDDVTGSGPAMSWCNDESNWPENVDDLTEIAEVRSTADGSGWSS